MKKIIVSIACVALVVLAVSGCATTAPAPKAAAPKVTPEDPVKIVLNAWKDALAAKDIDKVMDTYSERYQGDNGGDKKGLKDMLVKFRDRGELDGLAVGLGQTKIVVTGDKATAGPIDLTANNGEMSLSLALAKEDGKWLIVSSSRI